MSLKFFHVLFVVLATLLSVGFAVWSFMQVAAGAGALYLVLGILGLVVAVALVIYGRWFLKKMKDVSYM
jgi:xanthosine utilization system XapX-like protein